jgi:ABC-type lipoprotein export system ATPase subunit
MSENQLAAWRGESVGIVFQFFQMLPALSLLQNVVLPMDFTKKLTPAQRRERAMHLLEMVGLADQAHKLPSTVSGGQQQRAAIARALANDPPLIVADEPTGNLDARTSDEVFDLFSHLIDEGKTLLMVTHDEEMAAQAQRVMEIVNGRIVRDAATADVVRNPTHSQKRYERNLVQSLARFMAQQGAHLAGRFEHCRRRVCHWGDFWPGRPAAHGHGQRPPRRSPLPPQHHHARFD